MLRTLVLCLNLFSLAPSLALAKENKVSLKMTDYLFESIGKLDDVIEEINYKEKINSLDRISFTISTLVYLTPITISMITYNLKYSSLLSVAVLTKSSSTVETTTTLSELINNFLLSTTSLKLLSETRHFQSNIESFTIHRNDLILLKQLLKEVRDKQFSVLQEQLKIKETPDSQFGTGIADQIIKSRPSYQAIYNECAKNIPEYKSSIQLNILEGSLHDLYHLTAFSPSVVKLQLDSKLMSPTLKKYLSQDVLPMALNNCFAKDPSSPQENYQNFVQRLQKLENLARGLVLSTAGTVFVAGQRLLLHPKIKSLTNYFSKTSLLLAKRAAMITTIITGIYCSFQLKRTYDISTDRDVSRYTSKEYKSYIRDYFKKDISHKIAEIESLLNSSSLKDNERIELQNELVNWKIVLGEVSTT